MEFVEHATGDWAIRFICVTLAVTPLVRTTGWTWWMKRRRMLGLFVSFYAALHFVTYLALDLELDFGDLLRDVRKRPYIAVGFAAVVLLVPLTVTSTDAMIRRLKKWWPRLHLLVYPVALLAVAHYYMLIKKDKTPSYEYAAVVAFLLLFRVAMKVKGRLRTAAAVALGALLAASASASPVVVELFTSQGCSSCPDADALVSRWGKAGFERGELIPLSYDVDYWDYLGWRDVFSTPAYTRRQRDYASALKVTTYTPQMVVAGRAAFVGSDEARAKEEAGRYGAEPGSARIVLASLPSPRVRLTVRVEPSTGAAGHLMLALFENGLVTAVRAGENGGRELRNDFVVRRLVDLGALPRDGKPFTKHVDEAWDPAWKKPNGGAAVFLQDPKTKAVTAAASLYPLGS